MFAYDDYFVCFLGDFRMFSADAQNQSELWTATLWG